MNVSISTADSDIKIKYGMFDLREEREGARHSLKYILSDLTDIKQSYIRLGFHLIEFNAYEYYKDFGYLTFSEFCEENIPLDKSAISRCMAVCENFCIKDTPFSRPKMFLDSRYSDFNYSQLCEMVSMKEDDRKKITSDMSVKQIRELKKDICKCVVKESSQVATSQQEHTFDKSKLFEYKGAVLQNYVKRCSVDDCKHLYLFDENGKEIHSAVTCDILAIDDNCIYLRKVPELVVID